MDKTISRHFLRIDIEHIIFFIFFSSFFLLHLNLGKDFYWHLKTGELIFQAGTLPFGDPFSFTYRDEPWVLHEWLFEYILYLVHLYSGLTGVKLMSSALLTTSVYIVYRSAVALTNKKYTSLVLAGFSFFFIAKFGLPRPQLFTYLFLSIYIYILIGFKYNTYKVRLVWLPLIMLVWVNTHAGYAIGLALITAFIFGEIIDKYYSTDLHHKKSAQLSSLILVTVLCYSASLINPYSYLHWLYPFEVMSMEASKLIAEWLSPNFHLPEYKLYLIYVLTYLFLRGYSRTTPSIVETALPLGLIFLSFVSKRHIPVAILLLLPFYALTLKSTVLPFKTPKYISVIISSMARSNSNSRRKQATSHTLYSWILLCSLIAITIYINESTNKRLNFYEEMTLPVDAVNFIKSTGIEGNVFNGYGMGGYVIYSLYPESKVFIDGRADLYGDAHIAAYSKIINATNGWKEQMEEYPIDYIIFKNNSTLAWPLSQQSDFVLVFRDRWNSVYVRNNEKHSHLIQTLGNTYISKSKKLLN